MIKVTVTSTAEYKDWDEVKEMLGGWPDSTDDIEKTIKSIKSGEEVVINDDDYSSRNAITNIKAKIRKNKVKTK